MQHGRCRCVCGIATWSVTSVVRRTLTFLALALLGLSGGSCATEQPGRPATVASVQEAATAAAGTAVDLIALITYTAGPTGRRYIACDESAGESLPISCGTPAIELRADPNVLDTVRDQGSSHRIRGVIRPQHILVESISDPLS